MSNRLKWLAIGGAIVSLILTHLFLISKARYEAEDAVLTEYQNALVKTYNTKLETEKALHMAALKGEREKYEQEKRIADELRSTIASLQQRPTSSQLNSAVAEARRACTGAELSREDAEFLAREAARADRVIQERKFYYEQYEYARGILESTQRENERLYGEISNRKSNP